MAKKISLVRDELEHHLKAQGYDAEVFSFGAVDIDPGHLAVWIRVPTDKDKGSVYNSDVDNVLRGLLHKAGYPEDSIGNVALAVESDETVYRDYNGNWWYARK